MRLQARRPFPVGSSLLGGPSVLLCVPLVAATAAEAIRQARELGAMEPDCIEWRADHLVGVEPAEIPSLLAELAGAARRPLVVTNRHSAEGGKAPQDEERRIAVLAAAAASGIPAMVDVELATSAALARQVSEAAGRTGVRVIRSWHDFTATPSATALLERLRAMQEAGADAAKVAVMPEAPEDVIRLLSAGLEARRTFLDIPCILMSMGVLGSMTRLAGGYFGSDLTFAVGELASAPGQIELGLVRRALAALGLGGPGGA